MENLFAGALIGTIFGAVMGFKKVSAKERGTGTEALGCDAPYLIHDEYLYELLKELRRFAHADWRSYNTIVKVCDLLVQLWYHVHGPDMQPEVYLARRSFQYKLSVLRELKLFWASVMNVKPVITRRGAKTGIARADLAMSLMGVDEEKKTNTAEYNRLADLISKQVMAYNQEIMTKLSEHGRIDPDVAQAVLKYTAIDDDLEEQEDDDDDREGEGDKEKQYSDGESDYTDYTDDDDNDEADEENYDAQDLEQQQEPPQIIYRPV